MFANGNANAGANAGLPAGWEAFPLGGPRSGRQVYYHAASDTWQSQRPAPAAVRAAPIDPWGGPNGPPTFNPAGANMFNRQPPQTRRSRSPLNRRRSRSPLRRADDTRPVVNRNRSPLNARGPLTNYRALARGNW